MSLSVTGAKGAEVAINTGRANFAVARAASMSFRGLGGPYLRCLPLEPRRFGVLSAARNLRGQVQNIVSARGQKQQLD